MKKTTKIRLESMQAMIVKEIDGGTADDVTEGLMMVARIEKILSEARSKRIDRIMEIAKMVVTVVLDVFTVVAVLSFEHFVPSSSKLFSWIRPLTIRSF